MARSPPPTASELKRKPPNWLAFASELKNEPLVWLAFASELKNKPPNWLAFASCASRERANFPEMPTSGLKDYEHLVVRMEKIMAKCTLLLEQAHDCYPPKRKIGKV